MYFKSKRDWWLGWIIWLVVALPPVMLIKSGEYLYLPVCIPVALFVCWIWFRTGYTVTEKELEIKSGFIQFKIPLEEIIRIRKSNSPFSSPALSLDRLEIRYGNSKKVLISPENKESFIKAIRKRNQDVEIQ